MIFSLEIVPGPPRRPALLGLDIHGKRIYFSDYGYSGFVPNTAHCLGPFSQDIERLELKDISVEGAKWQCREAPGCSAFERIQEGSVCTQENCEGVSWPDVWGGEPKIGCIYKKSPSALARETTDPYIGVVGYDSTWDAGMKVTQQDYLDHTLSCDLQPINKNNVTLRVVRKLTKKSRSKGLL